ncbi:anti-sigma regulatory factor (Ser/Thr protein kinase) [Kitasatospora sp. MAA4]|uniref:ATP-binding protein n=1 Tax=Kitasatospora sp. MAA4 TaxID=3035093 RepID=UPI0024749BAC|nr:ATP-binding protein [Kitasatospora sp. MAA4]MDH6132432.1 anti-sigma regulatory factor (Ser/Thr protein kinase) [Kitasatospora sp. MAA4]
MRSLTDPAPGPSWHMAFASDLGFVPIVRAHVRRAARQWGYHTGLIDDLELVAAELASNAVIHGQSCCEAGVKVALAPGPYGLTVEVHDASAMLPTRRQTDCEAEGGRGLLIVQALSLRWGVVRRGGVGKRTWALIAAETPSDLACPSEK